MKCTLQPCCQELRSDRRDSVRLISPSLAKKGSIPAAARSQIWIGIVLEALERVLRLQSTPHTEQIRQE